jgi:UDP-N-acetylglucosamine--N-acetylmuramyl-(pentapeptide) pyrophosphoryl-undecaprenol N-acetylglucosamine transferase
MSRSILIMAGGTGGHIMPGLALAEAMRNRGWAVRWLGTAHGMENRLVPNAGIDLDTLAFSGLRGKGAAHALRGAWQLVRASFKSLSVMRQMRPNIVLGMGGYVTVPGGFAAAVLRRPLLLMNADARLLLSNRMLAPFARGVMFGLPPARKLSRDERFTGSPVRAEIASLPPPEERFAGRTGPLHLLVVGGSLGAAVLNRVVPEAIASLSPEHRPTVVHQSGEAHLPQLSARYKSLQISAVTVPFIDDIAKAYADADAIICRAGAITVNELTAVGVASILVPLSVSTTSHQLDNARYMEKAGAAVTIEQGALTAASLSEVLQGLSRDRLLSMASAARKLGRREATEAVVEEIIRSAAPEALHET